MYCSILMAETDDGDEFLSVTMNGPSTDNVQMHIRRPRGIRAMASISANDVGGIVSFRLDNIATENQQLFSRPKPPKDVIRVSEASLHEQRETFHTLVELDRTSLQSRTVTTLIVRSTLRESTTVSHTVTNVVTADQEQEHPNIVTLSSVSVDVSDKSDHVSHGVHRPDVACENRQVLTGCRSKCVIHVAESALYEQRERWEMFCMKTSVETVVVDGKTLHDQSDKFSVSDKVTVNQGTDHEPDHPDYETDLQQLGDTVEELPPSPLNVAKPDEYSDDNVTGRQYEIDVRGDLVMIEQLENTGSVSVKNNVGDGNEPGIDEFIAQAPGNASLELSDIEMKHDRDESVEDAAVIELVDAGGSDVHDAMVPVVTVDQGQSESVNSEDLYTAETAVNVQTSSDATAEPGDEEIRVDRADSGMDRLDMTMDRQPVDEETDHVDKLNTDVDTWPGDQEETRLDKLEVDVDRVDIDLDRHSADNRELADRVDIEVEKVDRQPGDKEDTGEHRVGVGVNRLDAGDVRSAGGDNESGVETSVNQLDTDVDRPPGDNDWTDVDKLDTFGIDKVDTGGDRAPPGEGDDAADDRRPDDDKGTGVGKVPGGDDTDAKTLDIGVPVDRQLGDGEGSGVDIDRHPAEIVDTDAGVNQGAGDNEVTAKRATNVHRPPEYDGTGTDRPDTGIDRQLADHEDIGGDQLDVYVDTWLVDKNTGVDKLDAGVDRRPAYDEQTDVHRPDRLDTWVGDDAQFPPELNLEDVRIEADAGAVDSLDSKLSDVEVTEQQALPLEVLCRPVYFWK